MSKPLLIAEKKNAALTFASFLGITSEHGSYVETPQMRVTWASGHLLETCDPEDYDSKWEKWEIETLPIVINNWKLRPSLDNNKSRQLKTIKELLKDTSYVINAGDAGREGQLIVDEILVYLKAKNPAKRLWLSDTEESSFKAAIKSMKDNQDYYPTYEAALARQRADALFGWNATRLLTLLWQQKGHRGVKSAGRVQSPTVYIVYLRHMAILNFKAENYWKVEGNFFTQENSTPFDAGWVFKGLEDVKEVKDGEEPLDEEEEEEDSTNGSGLVIPSWLKKPNRILEEEQAKKIARETKEIKKGVCSLYEKKTAIEKAPAMPALNELQGYMNKKFKITAKETLEIAQSLYEKGYTSYPRTDSRYLPTSMIANIPEILEQLKKFDDQKIQGFAAKADSSIIGACFNDAEVTDHYALCPTKQTADKSKLSKNELMAYEYICHNFLAQFFPHCEALKVKVQVDVGDHRYITTGRTVIKAGWREILGGEGNNKASEIPPLEQGQEIFVNDVQIKASITKPPPHMTEASLLKAMANVYRLIEDKEERKKLKLLKGIGRSATRDSIIETTIKRNFVERSGNYLMLTQTGKEFIESSPKEISDPGLTARWEEMMDLVEKKRISLEDFEKRLNMWVAQILSLIKRSSIPEAAKPQIQTIKACPSCQEGQLVVKTIRNGPKAGNTFLGCNRYPQCNHMEPHQSGTQKSSSSSSKSKTSSTTKSTTKSTPSSGDTCPVCKKGKMLDREVKSGPNQGKKFKGCSNFPACKNVIWPK